jgi:predicted RNA-binding Zn-ribbon protein involved in translation (DUF1610 family)
MPQKANAMTAARLKKSVQTGEKCTRCNRGIHSAAECTTKTCPECGSLFKHDWKTCDGKPKAFFLSSDIDTQGEKSEGENPETYSQVLKRKVKDPVLFAKLSPVGIGRSTNAYSALADTDVASLSPKQSDEEDELVSHALSPGDKAWDTNLSDTDDEES